MVASIVMLETVFLSDGIFDENCGFEGRLRINGLMKCCLEAEIMTL